MCTGSRKKVELGEITPHRANKSDHSASQKRAECKSRTKAAGKINHVDVKMRPAIPVTRRKLAWPINEPKRTSDRSAARFTWRTQSEHCRIQAPMTIHQLKEQERSMAAESSENQVICIKGRTKKRRKTSSERLFKLQKMPLIREK